MAWRVGTLASARPPERFTTARMVVRLWQPSDAEAMVEAITADLGHLREWMDWAKDEPKPVEVKRAFIEGCRHDYLRGGNGGGGGAAYGLFTPDEREVLGSIGYHHRIGEGAREIGYWMRSSHLNQGLITEAAGALTWVGLHLMNLLRLEIQCDPSNLASARVPAKLGYQLHATMHRQVKDMKLSPRSTMIWAIGRHELPSTSASAPTSAATFAAPFAATFAPRTINDQPAAAFVEPARQT